MAKDCMTVTIDRHLHDWIKEKGGNKSKIVNSLLHDSWINEGNKKPRKPTLANKKRNLEEHMQNLYKELGWEDE